MLSALECASYMGRISLLGCTRVSDSAVDYYNQVRRPGIKLIGAHNFVRPKFESYRITGLTMTIAGRFYSLYLRGE